MTSSQLLYLPTLIQCEEIGLVPWTQAFISFGVCSLLFAVLPRFIPGAGPVQLFLSFITVFWYVVTIIIALIHEYSFWHKHPDYEVFARCTLNKEFNEHLFLKTILLTQMLQKLTSCLMAMNFGARTVMLARVIFFVLPVLGLIPVFFARFVAVLGAGVGMGWPYIYLAIIVGIPSSYFVARIQANKNLQYMSGAETVAFGTEDKKDAARSMMEAAESAAVEAGEALPFSDTEDTHARLQFFIARNDIETFYWRIGAILCYIFATYISVVCWDWRYGKNGISYTDAFSAFDSLRPTLPQVFKNAHHLSSDRLAYIASTWS